MWKNLAHGLAHLKVRSVISVGRNLGLVLFLIIFGCSNALADIFFGDARPQLAREVIYDFAEVEDPYFPETTVRMKFAKVGEIYNPQASGLTSLRISVWEHEVNVPARCLLGAAWPVYNLSAEMVAGNLFLSGVFGAIKNNGAEVSLYVEIERFAANEASVQRCELHNAVE